MIKAGIFDVGGVLLQGNFGHIRERILQTIKIEENIFNKAYHSLSPDHMRGIITEQEFWEKLYKKTGVKDPPPTISIFAKHEVPVRRNDDLFTLIRTLKNNGLKVAILSNVIHAFTEESRKKGGIYEEFHEVILSCDVGMTKPDPLIYQHTLQKLKVKPEETFFVDDIRDNVIAAKNLGIHAFQYIDIKTLKKDLEKIGVMVSQ